MEKLSLHDPLFATYAIAATLMILKAVGMSWLTVVRMMQVKGGFRSPEDLRKTPLNPDPHPGLLFVVVAGEVVAVGADTSSAHAAMPNTMPAATMLMARTRRISTLA